MSIAHLTSASPRSSKPGSTARARDRLAALVTELAPDHLDAAEQLLAEIVAHQEAGTRGLSMSEVSVLERLGVTDHELREPTALTGAMKGRVWGKQLAQQSVTVTEAAAMLGVTPARIRQRCAAGTLIAQRQSDGWYLPLFQFPDERELRGWASVARMIPRGTPLLLVERLLTSPAERLQVDGEELAPFEWLAQGGDPLAAAAAIDDGLNRLP